MMRLGFWLIPCLLLGSSPAAAADLTIEVIKIDEVGAVAPAGAVEVSLQRISRAPGMGGGGEETFDALWQGVSGPDGRVRFEGIQLGAGQLLRPSARYGDVDYPSADLKRLGQDTVTLEVYEPTTETADLSMAIQLDISAGEGSLFVKSTVAIRNSGRATYVADAPGEPLRIPLLVPSLFGESVDLGLFPPAPDPNKVSYRVSPRLGRLAVERGAFFYRGPVPPGTSIQVAVNYPLPYTQHLTHSLALRPPVDVDRLHVDIRHADLIAPKLAPRRPHTPFLRDFGSSKERVMVVEDPPEAGEVFFVDVARVPGRDALNHGLALAGLALLAALFVIGMAAGVARGSDG